MSGIKLRLLASGVLVALAVLALSACGEARGGGGGQEANKESATGDGDVTNGQIAFRRWFDPDHTKAALFMMNPDGCHVRQITHPPKGWRDDFPMWSPDGKKVAFQRQRIDESTSRIMVVNPDTGGAAEITPCTGRCVANFDPAFSRDGDSIAFSRQVGPSSLKGEPRPIKNFSWPESKNYWAIFIDGLDGSHPHQITNIDPKLPANCCVSDSEPAFSPDGKMVVFARLREGPDEHQAIFIQPIGSPQDARQITPRDLDCQDFPEFSPDGKLVLFRCLPKGEEGPSNLYWVHPDGTSLHKLTHEEDADKQYLGSSFSPSFSGEGGWITAGRTGGYGDEGNADVFRLLIKDGEVVREVNLTKSAIWDSAPVWGSHQPVG